MSSNLAVNSLSQRGGWLTDRTFASRLRRQSWLPFLSIVGILLGGVGCNNSTEIVERSPPRKASADKLRRADLPSIRGSEFRNTGPDAKYVGSQTCVECHAEEYDSYLLTTHSRALADVEVEEQPPDGEVFHAASGRIYRVYRNETEFRHRELVKAPDGKEIVLADYPMRYVMGSGNNSRSYLVDVDGFLFESPVTWYTSREAWDMSPGYHDDPTQPGFSRTVPYECVLCHAGQLEAVGGSMHNLTIQEHAIGCERCHGPGSLHVEQRRAGVASTAGFDDSIVHPSHLPRERQEAICGQCHLATVAEANVRGRSIVDFRPSLYLSDFRVRFRLASEEDAMTVVGHIEQMRASRCYQMSEDMTCTTCHDMHGHGEGGGHARAGRESCLNCHAPEACGLPQPERLEKSATDDCVECHMPKSGTDIPHFAFRHHRVGIEHQLTVDDSPTPNFGRLIAVDDLDHLEEADRQRCLGLAYVKLAEEGEVENPSFYYQLAVKHLEDCRKQGVQDGELESALARVYLHLGELRKAANCGRSGLLRGNLSDQSRGDLVGVLSRVYMNEHKYALALPYLEDLIRFRYDAEDYLMLAVCRHRLGDISGALSAIQKSVQIEPDRPDLNEAAAELYAQSGDLEKSEWYWNRSEQLRQSLRVVVGDEPTEVSAPAK